MKPTQASFPSLAIATAPVAFGLALFSAGARGGDGHPPTGAIASSIPELGPPPSLLEASARRAEGPSAASDRGSSS